MIRHAVAVVVLLASFTMCVDGQTATAPDLQYIFIDRYSSKKVIEAGNDGFAVQCVARFAQSMILKRDGRGPRVYRLINTARLSSFVKDLNEAAAGGFRVVPASVQGTSAVLEQQPNGARFKYSTVEGTNDDAVAKAVGDARNRGLALVAMLGGESLSGSQKAIFLYEESEGEARVKSPGERDYRIAMTGRTSTLEKEITQVAVEGFRVIAAGGILAVLMERDGALVLPPTEYRVIAMRFVSTGERELLAAGAEGFRIAVVPDHSQEAVFVLHRTPGTSERFDYRINQLKTKTANAQLVQAETDGFRIAVLFNDLVVFERPSTR